MKNTTQASNKHEKRVAKSLGERQVTGGGRGDFAKGDVFGTLFIECKTQMTAKASMTVKEEWFKKAKEQAFQMRRQDSAVSFSFDNQKDFYAVDERLFEQMYRAYKAVNELTEFVSGNPRMFDSEDMEALRHVLEKNGCL
jgi:hypothetical protein